VTPPAAELFRCPVGRVGHGRRVRPLQIASSGPGHDERSVDDGRSVDDYCPNDGPLSPSWRRSRLARTTGCTPKLVMIWPGAAERQPRVAARVSHSTVRTSLGRVTARRRRATSRPARRRQRRVLVARQIAREGHHPSARADHARDRVLGAPSAWCSCSIVECLVVVEQFGQVVAVPALAGEVDDAAVHLSCLEVRGDPPRASMAGC
jgi:hypothetical protein